MATYTSHLNLKLPDYSDTADIKDLNDNFKKIDDAIASGGTGGGTGGIVVERDPTVPDWAKQPSKPTYTADEVGALPSTTKIPTVPTAIKNPYPLTINGVEYDGSEAKTVNIQTSGGGESASLDTTLTQYGMAADAGAVGNALAQEKDAREEALNELKEAIDNVSFETDKTLTLEDGVLRVNMADKVEEDNTLPVTSAAVYTEVGNINALLATI